MCGDQQLIQVGHSVVQQVGLWWSGGGTGAWYILVLYDLNRMHVLLFCNIMIFHFADTFRHTGVTGWSPALAHMYCM